VGDLQNFYSEFGQVRFVDVDGKPYAVASDVARALGYSRPAEAVGDHCKGTLKRRILTAGGAQEVNVIPEGDIYRLIVRSNLPDAERFERWVFDDVLPSINKHGAYMTPEKIEEVLLNPDTVIKLATALKEEREKRLLAESQVEVAKPKVVFADAVETSKSSVLIGELAKIIKQNGIDVGQNRLFGWLRENGYLGRTGENYNLPTQYSMQLGLMEIKKTTVNGGAGSAKVVRTPKITGKGQVYFVNKFIRESA
jgi:anti-repressor protein